MGTGALISTWRRCMNCGHVWQSSTKTVKTHMIGRVEERGKDGKKKKVYCGTGRLIRYPEHDEDVQRILAQDEKQWGNEE